MPAHNGPLDPRPWSADWAANREQYRKEARETGFGIRHVATSEQPALEASPEERAAAYEERWRYGGFALLGAFNDLVTDEAANATAAEFVRAKIREIVKDPEIAEKLSPKTYPIGAKRHLRRHRLLRHLQPRQRQPRRPHRGADRADHAGRREDLASASTRSTPSSTRSASTR